MYWSLDKEKQPSAFAPRVCRTLAGSRHGRDGRGCSGVSDWRSECFRNIDARHRIGLWPREWGHARRSGGNRWVTMTCKFILKNGHFGINRLITNLSLWLRTKLNWRKCANEYTNLATEMSYNAVVKKCFAVVKKCFAVVKKCFAS